MIYEVIVEGVALQVEVTHCENTPPCPGTWTSNWDAQGCRELEFKVQSANDTGAVALQDGGFFNLTTYGIQFLQLARMVGTGGIQL